MADFFPLIPAMGCCWRFVCPSGSCLSAPGDNVQREPRSYRRVLLIKNRYKLQLLQLIFEELRAGQHDLVCLLVNSFRESALFCSMTLSILFRTPWDQYRERCQLEASKTGLHAWVAEAARSDGTGETTVWILTLSGWWPTKRKHTTRKVIMPRR